MAGTAVSAAGELHVLLAKRLHWKSWHVAVVLMVILAVLKTFSHLPNAGATWLRELIT